VDFAVDGVAVGDQHSTVTVDSDDAERRVAIDVAGTAPLARVTVVKNNDPWFVHEGTDEADADLDAYTLDTAFPDDEPVAGMSFDADRGSDADVYYLRVRQADGGMAWVGPLWVEVA
jgi:hypothetical protein